MNITTKFNVGDEIYVVWGGDMSMDTKPKKISKIDIKVWANNYVAIEYLLDDTQSCQEHCAYSTLKEAQDAYKEARVEFLRGVYGDYIDEYLALTQDESKN